MEEFKERQAKMAGVQSALQSGDLASGYVGTRGVMPVTSLWLTRFADSLNYCLGEATSPKRLPRARRKAQALRVRNNAQARTRGGRARAVGPRRRCNTCYQYIYPSKKYNITEHLDRTSQSASHSQGNSAETPVETHVRGDVDEGEVALWGSGLDAFEVNCG